MRDPNCLFCKIVSGEEPATKVWENGEFMAIKNKYPVAAVHLLVMPKEHVTKSGHFSGSTEKGFWDKIMAAIFGVIGLTGLSKTGY